MFVRSASHSAAHPARPLRALPALAALSALLCLLFAAPTAFAQPGQGDWGDAPEGVIAYPSLGVIGFFPTCWGGPAGYVWHGWAGPQNGMWWGPTVDWELDGNAGICPPPPYEQDECWGPIDGDGGLIAPDTYSIAGGSVVPCGQSGIPSIGATCSIVPVVAGGTFDARLTNAMPFDGFVNVLFDWNQDGRWAGFSVCPGGAVPEHAIINLPVPAGYTGLLSGLLPPAIQIGPNAGHVWVRLTISGLPAPPDDWDGAYEFELVESEDYLILVEDDQELFGDFGDAPEGVPAYPNGTIGEFPTCINVGPNTWVLHGQSDLVFFGQMLDWEPDGNAGVCPQPPYDNDECDPTGGDAGLMFPTAFTLTPVVTPATCSAVVGPNLTGCLRAKWGVDIDIIVNNFTNDERWVNVLADWDGDGKWTGALVPCPDGTMSDEHVLVNFPVPPGFSGPLSTLLPPDFTVGWPDDGWSWLRFTVSDQLVPLGWDGAQGFGDGETEDYLLRIKAAPVDAPEVGLGSADGTAALRFQSVRPNPVRETASIQLTTDRAGRIELAVYDLAGRRVREIGVETRPAGTHPFTWDGRDEAGRRVGTGVYFVRATMGKASANAKVVVVK